MADRPRLGRLADPAALVLTSLAAGPKHGYAITKDVRDLAGVRLRPGTLYGTIARLEEGGWIRRLDADGRRHPYEITASGRQLLLAETEALRRLVGALVARAGA
ncbi:MAG: PadR family transcriptional regulator [Candidatus Dormibacteria bacterium]